MAESVDALDSKSSARKGVRVRPPLRVRKIAAKPSVFQLFFIFTGSHAEACEGF